MLLIDITGNTGYSNPADAVSDVQDMLLFLMEALAEPPEDCLSRGGWDGLNHILSLCAQLLEDAQSAMALREQVRADEATVIMN